MNTRRPSSGAGSSSLTLAVIVISAAAIGSEVDAQTDPVLPLPYDIVEGWAQPFASDGFAFGGNSGVYAESPDRIFVLQRGETRLPSPVPAGFAGYMGSIGHNTLRMEGRTWQNVIFVFDGNG
ncbi:MAG: hypothetical protein AAF389_19910, partial [Gemmatimonadota bacterium]